MIELQEIDVTFDGKRVIEKLSLSVSDGEFFTLLGPSGCGKTTLLRTVSGFVNPSAGRVYINGQDVSARPPEDRGIGVVFQNYALFPHMSVYDNVAYGLRTAGASRARIRDEVPRALERIGVADHARKKPAELSGGQQQRVAIARALILGTKVLLFDEPLSNLDAKLREVMRDEIRDIQTRLGLTVIYVTHDQQEALAISDRIAVMNAGKIRQIGSPRALYTAPADRFACTFIGETSRLPSHLLPGHADVKKEAYVRPEHIRIGAAEKNDDLGFETSLERVTFLGARQRLQLRHGNARLIAEAPSDFIAGAPDAVIAVHVRRSDLLLFDEASA
ncbi:ABC transporter ATP-binding protein [Stappia sp. BW2]|uniref:ABC transporter ATP-binding protein n=1 Tax=Stappia sp. BW2 TaxID=2592622 RepID=UPI0011DE73D8|nr:ABC transporter ATP-binding protein [Stappia sp. BW2]TYC77976.1 ABC transporter ATP-binding protein [Stappia sp. BW2]